MTLLILTLFSRRSVRFGTDSSQVFNLLQSGATLSHFESFDAAFMNFFYSWLTFEHQGLAAAVQLNQYLEENAIIQLDQKAGKDQGKFQVKTDFAFTSVWPFSVKFRYVLNMQNLLYRSCRWTSRSLRTLWKIGWSNMLPCNTPETRRQLNSKLIISYLIQSKS